MLGIDLSGQIALVTGGARGIGRACVETLAAAGAVVIFTHTGDPARKKSLDDFLAKADTDGLHISAMTRDARDTDGMSAVVNEIVKRHGRVDILVHNAGMNVARPAETISREEWQHYLDLNLTSAYNSVHAVLPQMLHQQRGRILLIGSSAVVNGGGGALDYAAAKAGLTGIMTYLSKEYARKGILTNLIHPAVIETDLLKNRYRDEASRNALIAQIPVGRMGRPEDIAGLVAFLASRWGEYICGQAILVDGGRTLYR